MPLRLSPSVCELLGRDAGAAGARADRSPPARVAAVRARRADAPAEHPREGDAGEGREAEHDDHRDDHPAAHDRAARARRRVSGARRPMIRPGAGEPSTAAARPPRRPVRRAGCADGRPARTRRRGGRAARPLRRAGADGRVGEARRSGVNSTRHLGAGAVARRARELLGLRSAPTPRPATVARRPRSSVARAGSWRLAAWRGRVRTLDSSVGSTTSRTARLARRCPRRAGRRRASPAGRATRRRRVTPRPSSPPKA